jgi:hypothetical protein
MPSAGKTALRLLAELGDIQRAASTTSNGDCGT